MKNRHYALLTLLLLLLTAHVDAQIRLIPKRKVLTPAEKLINEGDDYYQLKGGAFKNALELYLRAYVTDSYDPMLNYKIGVCYLSTINKIQAIPYLQKAYQLKPNISRDVHLLMGLSYQLNMEFDEAVKEYQLYKKAQINRMQMPTEALQAVSDNIDKKIEECLLGKEMVKHPAHVLIENLGPQVNSAYAEYAPIIKADESELYFTARKDNTTGEGLDEQDIEYYEDIYCTKKANGVWQEAFNLGQPINSTMHDATAGISPDGQRLFIYKGDNGGDIYECRLNGNEWSAPEALPKPINSIYHETTVSLSFDEKTMYFVSDRPQDNLGGRDIYRCRMQKNGKWGKPENLGSTINTEFDEDGVCMLPDNRTIYFSSQGHRTMGGYDIFRSTYDEKTDTWSAPENLGYPINTPDDDVYLSVAANGRHAYFSSFNNNGKGEKDLYMVTFLGPEKEPVLALDDSLDQREWTASLDVLPTNRLTIFKGSIVDETTGLPVEATLEITDLETNRPISQFTSNSSTGAFLVSLPSGANYGVVIRAANYLFHDEQIDIPATTEYRELERKIVMSPIAVGSKVVVNTIFFDHDQSKIKKESIPALERLLALMQETPSMIIEISGHTNNIASAEYNQCLSENRADAVGKWLVAHGVDSKRLVLVGYGGLYPIESNATREGLQRNRRTEFRILKL